MADLSGIRDAIGTLWTAFPFLCGFLALVFVIQGIETQGAAGESYAAIVDVCGRHFETVAEINSCIDGIWGE